MTETTTSDDDNDEDGDQIATLALILKGFLFFKNKTLFRERSRLDETLYDIHEARS